MKSVWQSGFGKSTVRNMSIFSCVSELVLVQDSPPADTLQEIILQAPTSWNLTGRT